MRKKLLRYRREKFSIEKKSQSRSQKIWSRKKSWYQSWKYLVSKKVSVSVSNEISGLVTQWSKCASGDAESALDAAPSVCDTVTRPVWHDRWPQDDTLVCRQTCWSLQLSGFVTQGDNDWDVCDSGWVPSGNVIRRNWSWFFFFSSFGPFCARYKC